MYIQAWNMRNGAPQLILSEEGLTDELTSVRPPEGIYQPFYFNEEKQEWESFKSEDNESGNKEPEEDDSYIIYEDVATLNMEEQIAHLLFENSKLRESTIEAEEEISTMMFKFAEMVDNSKIEEDVDNDDKIPDL